ncbi:signal peptidase I [Microbacterium sp.]|uniref:signal peptidase I n=1 Tax=Microbacterium sp. TaxID=51671 RepID=UPI0039E59829
MTSTAAGPIRSVAGAVAHGLSIGVLLIVFGLGLLVVALPGVVGGMPLTILTGSMSPGLPPGSLVVVKPVATEDIAVGDVITFQLESGKPTLVTHRVAAKVVDTTGATRFVTKGDANASADADEVLPVQVRGTVWYALPYLGWVATAVTGEHRMIVITLTVVVLFGYATWTFGSALVERRRRGATREQIYLKGRPGLPQVAQESKRRG